MKPSAQFKIIKDDANSYTVADSSGGTFRVAKKGLSKDQMDRIQNFASGGIVDAPEEETTSEPTDVPSTEPQLGLPSEALAISQNLGKTAPPEDLSIPETSAMPSPGATAVNPTVPVGPAINDSEKVSFGEPQRMPAGDQPTPTDASADMQKKGITDEATALATKGDQEVKAYQDFQKKSDNALTKYTETKDRFQKEQDKLTQELKDFKVDPRRLLNSMGTGDKILARISLFLGGFGARGGPNEALRSLETAVQRDIDSQLAARDNKKTLLAQYQAQTKDAAEAYGLTNQAYMTAIKAKVEEIAAKSQNPTVKARALQMIAPIDARLAQNKEQMALMSVQSRGAQGGIPESMEPSALRLNKDYMSKRVVVNGTAHQATSPMEAKELRNLQAQTNTATNLVERLGRLDPKDAFIPGSKANTQSKALISQIITTMKDIYGLGVLSEGDIKLVKDQVTDPTTLKSIITGGVANAEFLKTLQNKMDAKYKSTLSSYAPSVRTTAKPGFTE